MSLDSLNTRFAIDEQLRFITGRGDLPNAVISNRHGTATVSLYAGQVLSWRPHTQKHDVLFLSERAWYQPGKAIKGGVPVCWPWFGPDPQAQGRPAHGFARVSSWDVIETATREDGATKLVLGLSLSHETRALWPGEIEASLDITVGETLHLALTTHNCDAQAVTITQALHTYFAVGDITRTSVLGLEGCTYIDKVDGGGQKTQTGVITVAGEVDRIYTGVNRDLEIRDAALGRTIRIHAGGSHSAVVWNPWREIAANMADLDDDDYRRMLCVETANAGPDTIQVAAGGRHTLTAEYSVHAG